MDLFFQLILIEILIFKEIFLIICLLMKFLLIVMVFVFPLRILMEFNVHVKPYYHHFSLPTEIYDVVNIIFEAQIWRFFAIVGENDVNTFY